MNNQYIIKDLLPKTEFKVEELMPHRRHYLFDLQEAVSPSSRSLLENMSKGSTKKNTNSQTITLKVNVCCNGCQKKIVKALRRIDGVDDVTLEAEENKVTVTGRADSATLIRQLGKVRKRAELWGASNGEREEKARGGLRLPNLKRLLLSFKKGKRKKDDAKASPAAEADDDHDSSETDAGDGREEEPEPEENKSSSPSVHGGAPQPATETMMMGGENPYHYGHPYDQYMQCPWAMQQEQHRRMMTMMNERERYGCPPPANWYYGRPEAHGYGQQCMYESPDNCSVM